MDLVKLNKVLSNKTRLDILCWLKDPKSNFPAHQDLGHFNFGVCGLYIQEKSELSQSTISLYLTTMVNVDLLIPTRVGKWTYFRRNEKTISQYVKLVSNLI